LWCTVVAITAPQGATMPEPTRRYTNAWHHAQDDQERAWLDDWISGRVCAVTLETCPAQQPAPAVPALTIAGSPR
jgi:hypothetical protein